MCEVVLSLEAVEDVLRITLASGAKTNVISASKKRCKTLCDQIRPPQGNI
jgi:hypothetical protein